MALIPDRALDAGLNDIADNGDELFLCNAAPTNYTEASSTYALNAAHAVTVGDGNGDYTIANGDTSGRKLSLAQQVVTPNATDDATHMAITDGSSVLHGVWDLASTYSLASGTDFTLAAGDLWEIRDPS